jgi:hypothetical protein
LLAALKSISSEVQQKVEKAKAMKVTAKSKLGKIQLKMVQSTIKGMAGLRILKVADGKQVKSTGPLPTDSTHPLVAGEYELEYLFATPNYGEPTVTKLGKVAVKGGETRVINLGGIGFNIAQTLQSQASVDQVILADAGSQQPVVKVNSNNNGYYNFVPKAVLPGVYDVLLHYSHSPAPTKVADSIVVSPGKETLVILDSGITFKEVGTTDINGWDLMPLRDTSQADEVEDGADISAVSPLLQARPPFGNKSTLWMPYAVPPGKYRLDVLVVGMDEPLPVADDLEIKSGEILQFDSQL